MKDEISPHKIYGFQKNPVNFQDVRLNYTEEKCFEQIIKDLMANEDYYHNVKNLVEYT